MKLLELGCHVTTEKGPGYLIGREIRKAEPNYNIQLFDGTVCSSKDKDYPLITSISQVTPHRIDNPDVPAGLRSFLIGW